MCIGFEFGIHFCLGVRQLLKKRSNSLHLTVCIIEKYITQDEETVSPSSNPSQRNWFHIPANVHCGDRPSKTLC
jgi:hypothetical protein